MQEGPGDFGELLQRRRASAGLSQEELAERAGLSQRGISDLERGRRHTPYPATVRRLSEALDLPEAEQHALVVAARAPNASEVPTRTAHSSMPRSTVGAALNSLPAQT